MHDRLLLGLSGFLVVVICVVAAWEDVAPEYAAYQEGFREIVLERFGPERAAATPTGIQQIWIESADRVDRCTTCHLG
ncbi:MAG: hypothetical protein ACYTDU_18955, partial [Planctomycetota bacterium]